jgi:hypothetical protein
MKEKNMDYPKSEYFLFDFFILLSSFFLFGEVVLEIKKTGKGHFEKLTKMN